MKRAVRKKRSLRPSRVRRAPRTNSHEPVWADWSDRKLLKLRIRDLGIRIEGSMLESRLARLYEELRRKRITFRPHCWLSTEWFCPDGVGGIGIPFYLAHPRLVRLEHKQMLEAEGAAQESCMRILRHEAGHAIDNAYRLHRRQKWRDIFGHFSARYPEHYRPKPFSRDYVLHLDYWYAQSHPSEDFAETFAVWLKSGSQWRKRYQGWNALAKLEYVNSLMADIAERPAVVKSRRKVEPLSDADVTLAEYYAEKRSRYATDHPRFYDDDLRRLFADATMAKHGESAARFLHRVSRDIRRGVAYWTGQSVYSVNLVLKEMEQRCKQLRLRAIRPDEQLKQEAIILVTVQTMNFLHGGKLRLRL